MGVGPSREPPPTSTGTTGLPVPVEGFGMPSSCQMMSSGEVARSSMG